MKFLLSAEQFDHSSKFIWKHIFTEIREQPSGSGGVNLDKMERRDCCSVSYCFLFLFTWSWSLSSIRDLQCRTKKCFKEEFSPFWAIFKHLQKPLKSEWNSRYLISSLWKYGEYSLLEWRQTALWISSGASCFSNSFWQALTFSVRPFHSSKSWK
jgi:hypothetical protein